MRKIKNFNYKYLNIIKTIFFVFVISKLSILIFFQYPSPVDDSIYFISVSRFHCIDGIFRTPIFPIDENGSRYLWHAIIQPFLISILSYDCSIQSFYFAICLLIISTLFLVFFLKIKSFEKKFCWIFSIIIFSLQVKQGFRPEIISILLILLIEYFFLKKNYLFTMPLVFLAWSHPAVFLIEIIFITLRLNKELFFIFLKNFREIFFIIIFANVLIVYLYPFNIYEHINFLIKHAQFLNTKIPSDIYTYYIRSDFFPLFGLNFFFILLFLFNLSKRFILLCFPIYYFGIRFPETYYNLIPLYISIIYYINYILSEKFNKKSLLLNIFKYYLLFVFFTSIIGLSQGLLRDLISKLNYNSSLVSTKKIYNDLIAHNNEVCEIPAFFTLFLNFDELEKNFTPSKKCNKKKKNIVNIYPVNGYNLNKLKNKNCVLSHKNNNIFSFINPFKSDSGYSVYICKER